MPNGGSDCCGTCWYNAKNKGQAGYEHAKDPEPDYCTIRELPLSDAFYTYCGNHPHRRPERDPIPIGPVYRGNSLGNRRKWKSSPDNEEIRQHLLTLLDAIQEQPQAEYPIGHHVDETAVWQLGEFREKRAVAGLTRIVSFRSESRDPGPFGRDREELVQLAREALDRINESPA